MSPNDQRTIRTVAVRLQVCSQHWKGLIQSLGPCDHEAGVCWCEHWRTLGLQEEAIKALYQLAASVERKCGICGAPVSRCCC